MSEDLEQIREQLRAERVASARSFYEAGGIMTPLYWGLLDEDQRSDYVAAKRLDDYDRMEWLVAALSGPLGIIAAQDAMLGTDDHSEAVMASRVRELTRGH